MPRPTILQDRAASAGVEPGSIERPLPVRSAAASRGSQRRRWLRWSLAALAALLVMLVLDAVWVTMSAGQEVRQVRERLTSGGGLLERGLPEEASGEFALARGAAVRLRGSLWQPAAVGAGLLPWLSDDLVAARALAAAAELVARAGEDLADAASAVGWDGTTVPGVMGGMRIDTRAIDAATPELEAADRAVEAARRLLDPIRTDGLFGSLRDAIDEARVELSDWASTVHRATLLARLLPSFLGEGEPRRYLLIVQNLSDPRGSGGHVGSHGVLEVDAGRLRLGEMIATATVPPSPVVDAPADVETRYERFGSLTRLTAVTYPPDFATAARLLLAQWEARGEDPADGVVSIDAVAMSYILGAIGPVQTPAWNQPITAANVSDVLGRATFALPDEDPSNAVQSALAEAVWEAFLGRTPQARPFGAAIARAARERHLQIYSVHPDEQASLQEIGAAGRLPESRNPLLVTWFGASDARTGYFAEKDVEYVAKLSSDGSAEVTVTASLQNLAPNGPPSILLGSAGADAPVGSYHAFVNLYLPRGAQVLDVRGGIIALEEEELGAPVVLGLIGAESGDTARISVTFRLDGAVRLDDVARRFDLDVLPQPALRPDHVRVIVDLPAGTAVLAVAPGVLVDGGTLTWEGSPTTPEHVWVRFG